MRGLKMEDEEAAFDADSAWVALVAADAEKEVEDIKKVRAVAIYLNYS